MRIMAGLSTRWRQGVAVAVLMLACISHHPPAAAAQWHALPGFPSVGALDRVLTMPARSSVAKASHAAPLNRLATNGGEKCRRAPCAITEAEPLNRISVGVLKYGTVTWELDVIRRHRLDAKAELEIAVVELASPQALKVALQSGAVDVIVGDWIWAARQREMGRHYYFFPYSTAVGDLVIHRDAGIQSFTDLKGKVLGVAGGSHGKNWLLFQAFARQVYQLDLTAVAEIKYAAPPMLNQLMRLGKLDAVFNFWHYSSELNEEGMPTLLTMPEVLTALGVEAQVPMLGWLFKDGWAQHHSDVINRFMAVSYQARSLMLHSDEEWTHIAPLNRVGSGNIRRRLRDAYRLGIPRRFGETEKQALAQVFDLVAAQGGQLSVGNMTKLPNDIFWENALFQVMEEASVQ